MSNTKRVAIVGVGVCGLPAIKSCLEEGLEPVCFERTNKVAGLWNFSQTVEEGAGSVMRSTVNNSSKEMTCYSDFPMPKEYPNYMHNMAFLKYFQDYARHFQLQQYIRHRTEVKRVSPAPDYQTTGKWTLQVEDLETGVSSTEVFDAVMVSVGHHANKYQPSFPGQADFQGQVLHAHDYRDCSGYGGKRVVVVGVGNSGCDIVVELSRLTQVFLSTRRGTWVFHRKDCQGIPYDTVFLQRVNKVMGQFLPTAFFHWFLDKRMAPFISHDLKCLIPQYSKWAQAPTVNDDLGQQVAVGNVKVKPNIKRFTTTGVEFQDGSFEDNIDVVIMATGYELRFPFIDKSVVDVQQNRLPFYKYMFHPDLPHPTLAIIGGPDPIGGTMPMAEMQGRVAARVFKGHVKMPPSSIMWEDIHAKERDLAKRFVHSMRHVYLVDFVAYLDELAEMIGCKPNPVSLLKTDPKLAYHVLFGPCTPVQYRLVGPGRWEGARDIVVHCMDRIRYPIKAQSTESSSSGLRSLLLWVLALGVLVYLVRAMFL